MKAAIVGLGCIAPMHLISIQTLGEELVAICDIDREKAEAFKKSNSLSCPVYTDYKEMLDKETFDVLHVCTPHYLHCEMICEALSRNVNVFSEKPVAISEEQLELIHRALENTNAQLAVSHQNRYNASIQYARELLKTSQITSAVGVVAWCRDEKYYKQASWRGKWATEGGGLVINQAIHTLDMLMHFCGMPKSVIAHTSNDMLKGIIEVEDTCNALFKVSDSVRFTLMGTNTLTDSLPCVLIFKNSEHTVCIYNNDYLIVDGVHVEKKDIQIEGGKREWGVGHVKIIADFYEHIRSGEHFPMDISEAEKAIKMILALYKSNGEEIEIM